MLLNILVVLFPYFHETSARSTARAGLLPERAGGALCVYSNRTGLPGQPVHAMSDAQRMTSLEAEQTNSTLHFKA